MVRMLFNRLSLISLILCFLTIVFWVRSYPQRDVAGMRWSARGDYIDCAIGTNRGLFAISIFEVPDAERARIERTIHEPLDTHRFVYHRVAPTRGPEPSRWWNKLGFAAESSTFITGLQTHSSIVFMPLWLPLLLTLVVPTAQCIRYVRRRRQGRCAICGYDLRASSDRCPECGAIPLRRVLLDIWQAFSTASLQLKAVESRVD